MEVSPTLEVSPRKELDYLLGKLQEEAAEIVCETSKALCFGLHERYTEDHPTNLERIQNEVKDLIVVARILEERYNLDLGINYRDECYENRKRKKIAYYSDLSKRLGLLED